MSYTICLTPHGSLQLKSVEVKSDSQKIIDEVWLNTLISNFEKDFALGLFALAANKTTTKLPTDFTYWRDFASLYLIELCKLPESSFSQKTGTYPAIPIPDQIKQMEMVLSAPPMMGGEYLSNQVLVTIWMYLDNQIRVTIQQSKKDLITWLDEQAPEWNQVGRVCFHLAENKRDPDYPFAFMATYAPGLSATGNVQHQPLGQALKEYAGSENKAALENLLTPIQQAATQLPFVEEMIDSGDIFYPLSWTPDEALQLLKDSETLEAAGLTVKLPNWWKKRTRPTVSVSVGNKQTKSFGMDAMLDFKVSMAIGDASLTKKEWQQILEANEKLIFIKGQWIEVDKEKLQQALDHWQEVEANSAGDGVTFLEGMRLLAGAPTQLNDNLSEDQELSWSMVNAGPWLKKTLDHLRDPTKHLLENQNGSTPTTFQGTLRPYQQIGKDWLHLLVNLGLGACLADDMGLGKTVQIISLLATIKEESKGKTPPSILVLPASLINNWKAEIETFSPTLRTLIIHPSATTKEQLKSVSHFPEKTLNTSDIILTTYGMLLRQPWLTEQQWNLAILDEAQAIKNPNSRQTKATKKLKANARIALTGTPVENNLSDLWSLFDYISPGLLGNLTKFKQFTKSLEKRQHDQFTPLRTLISPYILRRLKTDKTIITDLPDKTELKTYCTLTKQQAALYQTSVNELEKSLQDLDGIQRRGLIFSFLMRFKQICNHPDQLLGNKDYHIDNSGKLLRLKELCQEVSQRQEKVLVFTQFKEMTQPLAATLEEIFGCQGLILHGGTPVKQRQKMVKQFQDPDGPPFFVLSLKAGGTGLTLTEASHVIHFDRWWNPAVENQATDRAFRIGQKRNVLVHKFITKGTFEEKIDTLIQDKSNMANELLEGEASTLLTEMSNEELINTVSLDIDQTII